VIYAYMPQPAPPPCHTCEAPPPPPRCDACEAYPQPQRWVAPPPAPRAEGWVEQDDGYAQQGDAEQGDGRQGYEQQGYEQQGYAYQRQETVHDSGWSYREDDSDGRQAAPPPCDRGCDQGQGYAQSQGYAQGYANGGGQWQDGSYGAVYRYSGRDAGGYLVWPGKTPDDDGQ